LKLGILVNTDKHLEDLAGITKAALSKGHQVIIFFMDDGVKLLTAPAVNGLAAYPEVDMSYCDYSTQCTGSSTDGIHENIVCGSQFNNATMNHEADRVIVL
jgi:predicted peroxiredoxin